MICLYLGMVVINLAITDNCDDNGKSLSATPTYFTA